MVGVLLVLVWVVCAGLGWMIGNTKNRALDGFLMGLFLGVVGLVIIVFMKPYEREERPAQE